MVKVARPKRKLHFLAIKGLKWPRQSRDTENRDTEDHDTEDQEHNIGVVFVV